MTCPIIQELTLNYIGENIIDLLFLLMTERNIKSSWQGRYYEDFDVGDVYKHPYGRTVTETDDVWFTNVTMNTNSIHFNEVYASETEFGERLVNGTFVIALAIGMSVIDVSMNATANLGYDEVRHHGPVFHGDTVFAESEVVSKRESESRDHVGLITTELRAHTTRTTTSCSRSNGRRWCSSARTPNQRQPSRRVGWRASAPSPGRRMAGDRLSGDLPVPSADGANPRRLPKSPWLTTRRP